MSWGLVGLPIRAQDAPGMARSSWALDFWPRWPKPTGGVNDCFAAGWTDALARGYFVDPRSVSPDHRYAVIVPRFGVVRDGPNFVVELNPRRVVGVVGGPGFAFAKKADVGWRYTWAPDSASLVIEQAGEIKKDWARVGWRWIELHDGFIARETDLLKNPGKAPAWLDTKQTPTHEHSEPVIDVATAVLAESSSGEDAWSVQRDGDTGPLHMVQAGARVGLLPPVKAIGADAKGAVRELSSDEMSGLPLCFFSPDEKWLFVNQIARVDPETGRQWRIAALYWRNDAAEDKAATWKSPLSGSFDDFAWETFARRNQVPPETVAPLDATGLRDRTIEFVNWSEKSGRILVYMQARNGVVAATKNGKFPYYRWYCYFDTVRLAFEPSFELDAANDELRKTWDSSVESLAPDKTLLRVGDPGGATLFAPYSEISASADDSLNKNYQAVLERLDKDAVEETRQTQRHWLAYRETLARAHVLNRWPSFPEEVLREGRFLATQLRTEALKEQAMKAQPAVNKVVREKSPDGKYGLAYTYADDDVTREGWPHGVELVELPGQRMVLDLYDEVTNRGLEGHWSPDSLHLAFHSGSRRIAGITIYERHGNEFVELKSPKLEAYGPKTKKGEHSYHFDGSDLALKRWLGPKKLLAHYSEEFDVEDADGKQRTVSSDYDLILSIEKGKIVVEKATKTKPEN
ncbi:MAG: lysozyme inhibitor LprI family protein [Chthoniobacter sp.]